MAGTRDTGIVRDKPISSRSGHVAAAVARSPRRDLTTCRFVGVPPAIIVVPKLTTYDERVVDGSTCRPGAVSKVVGSARSRADDRISRLQRVGQVRLPRWMPLRGPARTSHPVRRRYIISRAPCRPDMEAIFTGHGQPDRVHWQPPRCTIYTGEMPPSAPLCAGYNDRPEHEPNVTAHAPRHLDVFRGSWILERASNSSRVCLVKI